MAVATRAHLAPPHTCARRRFVERAAGASQPAPIARRASNEQHPPRRGCEWCPESLRRPKHQCSSLRARAVGKLRANSRLFRRERLIAQAQLERARLRGTLLIGLTKDDARELTLAVVP